MVVLDHYLEVLIEALQEKNATARILLTIPILEGFDSPGLRLLDRIPFYRLGIRQIQEEFLLQIKDGNKM